MLRLYRNQSTDLQMQINYWFLYVGTVSNELILWKILQKIGSTLRNNKDNSTFIMYPSNLCTVFWTACNGCTSNSCLIFESRDTSSALSPTDVQIIRSMPQYFENKSGYARNSHTRWKTKGNKDQITHQKKTLEILHENNWCSVVLTKPDFKISRRVLA